MKKNDNNKMKMLRSILAFILVFTMVIGDVYVLADALSSTITVEEEIFEEIEKEVIEDDKNDELIEEEVIEESDDVEEEKKELEDLEGKKIDEETIEYVVQYIDQNTNEVIKEYKEEGKIDSKITLEADEDLDGYILASMSKTVDTLTEENSGFRFYYVKKTESPFLENYIVRHVVEENGELVDIAPRKVGGMLIESTIKENPKNIDGFRALDESQILTIYKDGVNEIIFEYGTINTINYSILSNKQNVEETKEKDNIVEIEHEDFESYNGKYVSMSPNDQITAKIKDDRLLIKFSGTKIVIIDQDLLQDLVEYTLLEMGIIRDENASYSVLYHSNMDKPEIKEYENGDEYSLFKNIELLKTPVNVGNKIPYIIKHNMDGFLPNIELDHNIIKHNMDGFLPNSELDSKGKISENVEENGNIHFKKRDVSPASNGGYMKKGSTIRVPILDLSKDESDNYYRGLKDIKVYEKPISVSEYPNLKDITNDVVINKDSMIDDEYVEVKLDGERVYQIEFDYERIGKYAKKPTTIEEYNDREHIVLETALSFGREELKGQLKVNHIDENTKKEIEDSEEFIPTAAGINVKYNALDIENYEPALKYREKKIVPIVKEDSEDEEKNNTINMTYLSTDDEDGDGEEIKEAPFIIEHIEVDDNDEFVGYLSVEEGKATVNSRLERKKKDFKGYKYKDGQDDIKKLTISSKASENKMTFKYVKDDNGGEEEPGNPEEVEYAVEFYAYKTLEDYISGKNSELIEKNKYKHAHGETVYVEAKDFDNHKLVSATPIKVELDKDEGIQIYKFFYLEENDETVGDDKAIYSIRHVFENEMGMEEDIVNRRLGVDDIGTGISAYATYIKGFKYVGYRSPEEDSDLVKIDETKLIKDPIKITLKEDSENTITFVYKKVDEDNPIEDKEEDFDDTDNPTIDPEDGKEENREKIYTSYEVNHRDKEKDTSTIYEDLGKGVEGRERYKTKDYSLAIVGVEVEHKSVVRKENDIYTPIKRSDSVRLVNDPSEDENVLNLLYRKDGELNPQLAAYEVIHVDTKGNYIAETERNVGIPGTIVTKNARKDIGGYEIDEPKSGKITKELIAEETTIFRFIYKKKDEPITPGKEKINIFYSVELLDYETGERIPKKDQENNPIIYNETIDPDDIIDIDINEIDIENYTLVTKTPINIKLDKENDTKAKAKEVQLYYVKDGDIDKDEGTLEIRHITEETQTVDGKSATVKKDIIDRRVAHGRLGSFVEVEREIIKGYKYESNSITKDSEPRVQIEIKDGVNTIEFIYVKDDDNTEGIDPEYKPEKEEIYAQYVSIYHDIDKFKENGLTTKEKYEILNKDGLKPIRSIVGIKVTEYEDKTQVDDKYSLVTMSPKTITIEEDKGSILNPGTHKNYKNVLDFGYINKEDMDKDKGEGSYTIRYVVEKDDALHDITDPQHFTDKEGLVLTIKGKEFTGFTLLEPKSQSVIIESGKHKYVIFKYELEDGGELGPGEEVEENEKPGIGEYKVIHEDFDTGELIVEEEVRKVVEGTIVEIYDYINDPESEDNNIKELGKFYRITNAPVFETDTEGNKVPVPIDKDEPQEFVIEHRAREISPFISSYTVRHTVPEEYTEYDENGNKTEPIIKYKDLKNRRLVGAHLLNSRITPKILDPKTGFTPVNGFTPVMTLVSDKNDNGEFNGKDNILNVIYKSDNKSSISTSYRTLDGEDIIDEDIKSVEPGVTKVASKAIEGYKTVGSRIIEINAKEGEIARVIFEYEEGEEVDLPEIEDKDEDEEIEKPEEDNNDKDIEEKPEESEKPELETPEIEEKPEKPSTSGGGGGGSAVEVDKEDLSKVDKVEETIEKDLQTEEESRVTYSKVTKDHTVSYLTGFSDGTIRPNENTTREEVATIVYRILEEDYKKQVDTTDHGFTDVNDIWSEDYIATLANAGIIEGFKDGSFKPKENMTRAEVTTMIARLMDLELAEDNKFKDTTDHWAAGYINAVAKEGWVDGYTDGSFRPNEKVTRAELVTMINNMLGRSDEEVEDIKEFKDLEDHRWYYDQIQLAIALD